MAFTLTSALIVPPWSTSKRGQMPRFHAVALAPVAPQSAPTRVDNASCKGADSLSEATSFANVLATRRRHEYPVAHSLPSGFGSVVKRAAVSADAMELESLACAKLVCASMCLHRSSRPEMFENAPPGPGKETRGTDFKLVRNFERFTSNLARDRADFERPPESVCSGSNLNWAAVNINTVGDPWQHLS